jgi:hypothetical protein
MRTRVLICAFACFICSAGYSIASDLLYLTERVSANTQNGVLAFGPGTKVRRTGSTADGLTVVTDDGVKLNVSASEVTADQAKGERLAAAESAARDAANAQAQMAAAAQTAQQAAVASQQQSAPAPVYMVNPVNAVSAVPQASGTQSSLPTSSDLYGPQKADTVIHHKKKITPATSPGPR